MGAAEAVLKWHGLHQDEDVRVKERAESAKLLAVAKSEAMRARRVAEKVDRMTTLYRERLEGTRERE